MTGTRRRRFLAGAAAETGAAAKYADSIITNSAGEQVTYIRCAKGSDYPLFFAITGQLQGLTFKQSFERAKRRYAGLFGVSTAFWLPVQLLQFLCVPAKYQVPFISLAGCVWNIILSAFGEAERVRPHAFGEPPKPKKRAGGLGRVMPVRRRVQREQLATAAGAA